MAAKSLIINLLKPFLNFKLQSIATLPSPLFTFQDLHFLLLIFFCGPKKMLTAFSQNPFSSKLCELGT